MTFDNTLILKAENSSSLTVFSQINLWNVSNELAWIRRVGSFFCPRWKRWVCFAGPSYGFCNSLHSTKTVASLVCEIPV